MQALEQDLYYYRLTKKKKVAIKLTPVQNIRNYTRNRQRKEKLQAENLQAQELIYEKRIIEWCRNKENRHFYETTRTREFLGAYKNITGHTWNRVLMESDLERARRHVWRVLVEYKGGQ